MKIIFLDIDGVLVTENLIINSVGNDTPFRDHYGHLFCPTASNLLNSIIGQTKADIVISSTWRNAGLDVMKALWKERNMLGNVIDVTPSIRFSFSEGIISTIANKMDLYEWLGKYNDVSSICRGHEIQYYIDICGLDIESYVIIDDNDDMLENQMSNFVNTTLKEGLNDESYLKVLSILG